MQIIFLCWFFLYENCCIFINVSLKFVPNGPINNKLVLVRMMAWHPTGAKPLSETMMAHFTDAYICHSASMG